eukprot:6192424-Pleurochrysis_carterae.AAC.5
MAYISKVVTHRFKAAPGQLGTNLNPNCGLGLSLPLRARTRVDAVCEVDRRVERDRGRQVAHKPRAQIPVFSTYSVDERVSFVNVLVTHESASSTQ